MQTSSLSNKFKNRKFVLPQISTKKPQVGDQLTKVFRNLQRVPTVFEKSRFVAGNLPNTNNKIEFNSREDELWSTVDGKQNKKVSPRIHEVDSSHELTGSISDAEKPEQAKKSIADLLKNSVTRDRRIKDKARRMTKNLTDQLKLSVLINKSKI